MEITKLRRRVKVTIENPESKEMKIKFDPECPDIGTCIHDEDLISHMDPPVCEHCGIPYYYAHLSGDWVHPFKFNNQIIGWNE